MRFKIKKKEIKVEPKICDTKEKIVFAILPVRINDDYCVWLERFKEEYIYKKVKMVTYNSRGSMLLETSTYYVDMWELKRRKIIYKV